jgi:uridine phosphorylase
MELQHHILLGPDHLSGNGGLGRYVLLPGDRSRAAAIARSFTDVTVVANPRGLDAHLGTLVLGGARIDVLSISSGMGTPSTEIVMHELIAAGARRVVRVGSCGSLDPNVRASQVAILTGAVRDELASRHIAPVEFPAVSHPEAVAAMAAGAVAAGLGQEAFLGVGHTKASLYAREFGKGPLGEQNRAYGRLLSACGAIASDMEASMLFIQASVASARQATPVAAGNAAVPVQAACVLGVYGDDDSNMKLDPAQCRQADARCIAVALHGIVDWARRDGVWAS